MGIKVGYFGFFVGGKCGIIINVRKVRGTIHTPSAVTPLAGYASGAPSRGSHASAFRRGFFGHICIATVHRIAWIPLRFIFNLLANFTVFGIENIADVPNPAIFIANHSSYFDPFLVGIAMPWRSRLQGIQWLTRDDKFERPIHRHALRLFGAFAGKIPMGFQAALEKPLALLSQNASVGVFPEWCYDDDLLVLERMQFVVPLLAEHTRYPIVPVFLFGVERVTWARLFRRHLAIHVVFGKPLWPGPGATSDQIWRDVTALLAKTRLEHLNQFIHAEERSFWNEYGRFYQYLERADAYHELVGDFEALLPERISGTWVDLGSGSGKIVELLLSRRERSETIIASDHNESMLSQLRVRFPSDVSVTEIDLIHRLPFEDHSVSGVTANLVLPYVVHHQGIFGNAALRKLLVDIHRILKPGGILVWSTPKDNVRFIVAFIASLPSIFQRDQQENIRYSWNILRQALSIQSKGRRGIYHFLERKDLILLLEEIGFKNIQFNRSMAGQVYLMRCER